MVVDEVLVDDEGVVVDEVLVDVEGVDADDDGVPLALLLEGAPEDVDEEDADDALEGELWVALGVQVLVGGHKTQSQGFGSGAFQFGGGVKNTSLTAGPQPGCQSTLGLEARTFNFTWVCPVVVGCVPWMNHAPSISFLGVSADASLPDVIDTLGT